jgi:hypothetical protein
MTVLAALITVATLITKIIDFILALIKHKSETMIPDDSTAISKPSHRNSKRNRRAVLFSMVNLVYFVISMVTLMYLVFYAKYILLNFQSISLLTLISITAIVSNRASKP